MLLRHVQDFIEERRLITPGARVLVGVSGGVDSIVLMYVLKQLGYVPVAAHVNYQRRGAASDGDAAFVEAFCERLGVPFYGEVIDKVMAAAGRGMSFQAAAREARYGFFARVAETEDLPYVALAHHLDDQAETVLLHLLRGAGPEGLAGMPVRRPLAPGSAAEVVRPLLGVRRHELEAFARNEGLAWREDESNTGLTYQRNVLRGAVLPLLEEHFGAAAANIARSAALMRDYVDEAFRLELAAHFDRAAQPKARRLTLDALGTMAPVWRRRVLLEALHRWLPGAPRHAALAQEIEALVAVQPGRRVVLKAGTVWRDRGGLVFTRADEVAAVLPGEAWVHPGKTVSLGSGSLHIEVLTEPPARLDAEAPTSVFVDADRLVFPLCARRWQPGDRFQPFGMTGTKKVSDFLTDAKAPVHRRAGMWVLVSGEEIVWVVGMRLAEGVRVQPGTTRFAKFTYIQSM